MNISSGVYNIINKEKIKESVERIVASNLNWNTYSSPKGLKELRSKICDYLKETQQIKTTTKNILITTGSQQSLDLLFRILPFKSIMSQEPTYYGAINIIKKNNMNVCTISPYATDKDLEALTSYLKHDKLIYVVPTFHNPTGISWSNDTRKKFLDIVNKYNALVIEDDPYSLINFDDGNYDSLYKLNEGKNIIYLGTFSKYISPSVNVGFVVADDDIIDSLYVAKENTDLGTNILTQYIVLDYLNNNDIVKNVRDKRHDYMTCLHKSIDYIKQTFKDNIEWMTYPKGGLFYLVKLKKNCEKLDKNKYYFYDDEINVIRVNICVFKGEE